MSYGLKVKEPVFWKSQSGEIQSLDEMDEKHLRNTLRIVVNRLGEVENNKRILSQQLLNSKILF